MLSVPDFDHHLTTAVQMPCEMPEKACCDNQQWAFSRFGLNCAEPINFTFQRRSIPPCRSSPTRRPRFESSWSHQEQHLMGCCSFVLHEFCGAAKGGFEQPVPRALRPAGQKRPSGNFLFFVVCMMSLFRLPRGKRPLALLAVPTGKDGRVECPRQTVNDFIGIKGSVCGLFLLFKRTLLWTSVNSIPCA